MSEIEISVIDTRERTLSDEEKLIEYKKIALENDIPISHIYNFIELEKKITDDYESDLLSINMEKSIQRYQIYPIIDKLPHVSLDDLEKKYVGSAEIAFEPYSYSIYLSGIYNCVYHYDLTVPYKIYNKTINVIGYVINLNNDFMIPDPNAGRIMYTKDRILSNMTDEYLKQMIFTKDDLIKNFKWTHQDNYLICLFENEEHAVKITNHINTFYKLWDNTLNSNYLYYIHNVFKPRFALYELDIFYTSEEFKADIPEYMASVIPDIDKLYPGIIVDKYLSNVYFSLQGKPYSKDDLDNRRKLMVLYNKHLEIYKQKFERKYHDGELRFMYIRKFGMDEYAKIPKKGRISEHLDKKTLSVLENNLKKYKDYQALAQTKTEWSNYLYQLFRVQSEIQQKQIYRKLKELIPTLEKSTNPDTATIIEIDGIPAICQHSVDKYEDILNNVKPTYLQDYGIELSSGIFCKICGEMLQSFDDMKISFASSGGYNMIDMDDELYDYTWSAMGFATRSSIEFNPPKKGSRISKFITDMTYMIFPYMDEVNKRLQKNKTLSEDEYDKQKKVYTSMYAFALLAKIILENPDRVRFISHKFSFEKSPQVKDIVQFIADRVALNNPFDEAFIKENVINIFKQISRKDKVMLKSDNNDIIAYLATDIIYRELIYDNFITNLHKKGSLQTKLIAASNIEDNLMVKNIDDIKSLRHIYQKIEFKSNGKLKDIDLIKIAQESKTLIKFILTVKSKLRLHNIRKMIHYVKSQLYVEDPFIIEWVDNTAVIKDNPKYATYRQEYKYLYEIENNYMELYRFQVAKPLTFVEDINTYLQFIFTGKTYWSRVYGYEFNEKLTEKKEKKFHKHDWSLNVYVKYEDYRSRNLYDYPVSKLLIQKNIPSGYIFIDKICAICKQGWYNYYKIANIDDKVQEYFLIQNFYNKYTYKCPENKEPLHHYVKNKCKYCGITQEIIDSKDEGYYKKYKHVFQHQEYDVINLRPELIEVKPITITSNSYSELYNIMKYKKYKKEEIKIILDNLGLFEKQNLHAVLYEGVEIPKNTNLQINNLHMIICDMIIKIESMVNKNNIAKPPLWLEYLEKHLDEKVLGSMSKLHYPPNDTYMIDRTQLLAQDPETLLTFTKNYLADLLIYINKNVEPLFGYFSSLVIDTELASVEPEKKKMLNQLLVKDSYSNTITSEDNTFTVPSVDTGEPVEFGYDDMDYEGENDDD